MPSRKVWNGSSWVTLGGGGGGVTTMSQRIDCFYWGDTCRENYASGSYGAGFAATGPTYLDAVDNTNGAAAVSVGLRFQGVQIPVGATVTVATLTINAQSTTYDDLSCVVKAQDDDDAADFLTTGALDPTSRPRVAATGINWNATSIGTNTQATSPSLVTLVQDVVDRAGWVPGNAIAFILDPRLVNVHTCRFDSARSVIATSTGEEDYYPRLNVTWTKS